SRLSRLCVRGPRRHEKSDQIACVLGGQCASVPQGRHTVNTEPLPGSLATVTSPPIMRASLPAYALGAGGPPARLLDRRGERLAFFGNEKAQSLGRFASAGVLDIMHMLCRVVTRLTLGQGNAFMPIGLHDHGALQHVEVFRPGMKMLARLRAWRDLGLENNHLHSFDSDKIGFLEYCAFDRLVLRVQKFDSYDPASGRHRNGQGKEYGCSFHLRSPIFASCYNDAANNVCSRKYK